PTNETETILRMGEIAGMKLDLQWVPSDGYQEKINTSIMSGDLPDAITVLDPKNSVYVNAARAGMFWDLTDLLKGMEVYARVDPLIVSNAQLDGKNFYVPRTRMLTRAAILYRKDWLEKLNLTPPETMEDVYNIAKAFKEQDPDGNGKNDTFGLITAYQTNGDIWGFNAAGVYMGAGNAYVEDEAGKLIPTFETPEFKGMLDWYRRLYAEGILNQDFTIRQEKGFEMMASGQGGICVAQSDELENRFDALVKLEQVEKGVSNLQILDIMGFNARIHSPNGEIRIIGGSGFYGGYAFPKTKVTSEERLQKLLKAIDGFDSAAGQDIIQWGIEGVHHEIVNGTPVLFQDQQKWITDCCTLQQIGPTFFTSKLYRQGVRTPVQEAYMTDQAANAQYAVGDPTVPLISDTNTQKGGELRLILGDAYVKYMMGEIDEAGLRAEYDKWYAQGGEQVMKEFNEGYALIK
ncbi:MAG TPA: extracellular solute-binding protein, partial [Clostridia bacterium]|nr:extracellular solute-binding protein [Clostridia bacterium]